MKIKIYVEKIHSISHLIYVGAYLSSLCADDGVTKISVVSFGVGDVFGNATVLQEDILKYLPKTKKIEYQFYQSHNLKNEIFDKILYLARDKLGVKDLYKIISNDPFRIIRCIYLDEGLGSYKTTTERWYWIYKKFNNKLFVIKEIVKELLLNLLFVPKRWPMYSLNASGWCVNPKILEWVQNEQMSFCREKSDALNLDNVIYYISQPFVEKNILTECNYMQFLNELQNVMLRNDLKLVVRPHPAEDRSRYVNFTLDLDPYPIEFRQDIKNCSAILGVRSTAVLYFSSVHAVPAFVLNFNVFNGLNFFGKYQRSLFDHYTKSIASIQQLETVMNQFKKKSD